MSVRLRCQLLSKGDLDRYGYCFDADKLSVTPLLNDPQVSPFMGCGPAVTKDAA